MENYIPKDSIQKEIDQIKQMRLIQLLNWVEIKNKMLKKYPMIDDIQLNWAQFPNINIVFFEKRPWIILLGTQSNQFIYSYDGTLLNKDIPDVELPNDQLVIINVEVLPANLNQLQDPLLSKIRALDTELKQIPFFNLQQIKIKSHSITMLTQDDVQINVGGIENLQNKFLKLKHFLGFYRKKLLSTEYIDIRQPNRVIIKSINHES
tara:strand:+ start:209 stop:829 length:621 start_codon:yes stop_codon:yes gene_type:complete